MKALSTNFSSERSSQSPSLLLHKTYHNNIGDMLLSEYMATMEFDNDNDSITVILEGGHRQHLSLSQDSWLSSDDGDGMQLPRHQPNLSQESYTGRWLKAKRRGRDDADIEKDRKAALLQRRNSRESPKQPSAPRNSSRRRTTKTKTVPKTIFAASKPRSRMNTAEKAKLRQAESLQEIRKLVLGKNWSNGDEEKTKAVTPEQASGKDDGERKSRKRRRNDDNACVDEREQERRRSIKNTRIRNAETHPRKRRKGAPFRIHSPFKSRQSALKQSKTQRVDKSHRRKLFGSEKKPAVSKKKQNSSQESYAPKALFVPLDFQDSARLLIDGSQRTKWVPPAPTVKQNPAIPSNKRAMVVRGILMESSGSTSNHNNSNEHRVATSSSRPTTSSGAHEDEEWTAPQATSEHQNSTEKPQNGEHYTHNSVENCEPVDARDSQQKWKENDELDEHKFIHEADSQRGLLQQSDHAFESQKSFQHRSDTHREEKAPQPHNMSTLSEGARLSSQALNSQSDNRNRLTEKQSSSNTTGSRGGMLTQASSSSKKAMETHAMMTQLQSTYTPSTQGMLTQPLSSSKDNLPSAQESHSNSKMPQRHSMATQKKTGNHLSSRQGMLTQLQSPSTASTSSKEGMLTQESETNSGQASRIGMMQTQQGSSGIKTQSGQDDQSQNSPDNPQSTESMLFLPQHAAFDSQLMEKKGTKDHNSSHREIENNQNNTVKEASDDPLHLGFWKQLARRSENSAHSTSFQSALANLVIAKNQQSPQSQQNCGMLWLPSILEGDLDTRKIANLLN